MDMTFCAQLETGRVTFEATCNAGQDAVLDVRYKKRLCGIF